MDGLHVACLHDQNKSGLFRGQLFSGQLGVFEIIHFENFL